MIDDSDDTDLDDCGEEFTDLQRKATVRAFDELTHQLRPFQIEAINEAFRMRYVPRGWHLKSRPKKERVYAKGAA